ncbi:MAG: PIG-L deacetylase family protein [Pseudomonadota bacterium]
MLTRSSGTLLTIAAHPDDEVLGCAATVRRLVQTGWSAHLIVMTAGVAGRLTEPEAAVQSPERAALLAQLHAAADVVGYAGRTVLGFPDNRMDTVSRMDIAHALTPHVQTLRPDLVLTHHPGDYNWDHGRTFDAVMMAARANPPDHAPGEIWAFEVLSSTERGWQTPDRAFHPNLYVDIARTIDQKKLAMSIYQNEYRPYPHPRSIEGIEYLARKRGGEIGIAYAEAFHMIRRVIA